MFQSSFDSTTGLNLDTGQRSITYLYGLSDFWQYMFADSSKIDLLLEASAQTCSDIYSHFLQLTSTISLEGIQEATGYQMKLFLIADTDAVPGAINTYYLNDTVLGSRYLANQPLLPTTVLETEVHYTIIANGTQIQFASTLSMLGFPIRLNSNNVREFAVWMVDAKMDEQLISNYYAKLIDVNPQTSGPNFKNFVYGLFYLYTNGPNIALLRKGLNLALGIPVARSSEQVLQIKKYLDTDQFIVVTDQNSYIIPFGLTPAVATGDILQQFQELAIWVDVQDWENNGNWWTNLLIPQSVMPNLPNGQTDRHALPGSYADTLMNTWLKKHTFLVNVTTISFKNIELFQQLSSIIFRAKPTYTYPFYIWTVPNDEILHEIETLTIRWDQVRCEQLGTSIDRFNRYGSISPPVTVTALTGSGTLATVTLAGHGFVTGQYGIILGASAQEYNGIFVMTVVNSSTFRYVLPITTSTPSPTGTITATLANPPVYRGCPIFMRYNVPQSVPNLMGDNPALNCLPTNFEGGNLSGYINTPIQFRANTAVERGWLKTIMNRDSDQFRTTRGVLAFNRGITYTGTETNLGTTVKSFLQTPDVYRILPLYITTQSDLANKFAIASAPIPSLSTWSFTLFKPLSSDGPIDSYAINSSIQTNYFPLLTSLYSTMFFRGPTTFYLGSMVSPQGYTTWAPVVGDLRSTDYLLFIRIHDNIVGAYWVTTNFSVVAPNYFVVRSSDPITLTMNSSPLARGMGPSGAPYYVLRGDSYALNFPSRGGINQRVIDGAEVDGETLSVTYSDTNNPIPITVTRATETYITHKREYA